MNNLDNQSAVVGAFTLILVIAIIIAFICSPNVYTTVLIVLILIIVILRCMKDCSRRHRRKGHCPEKPRKEEHCDEEEPRSVTSQ